VELIDQTGRVERKEQVHGSTLKICDFDFGPHTLRVGTNECLPVSVGNIRLVMGRPLDINVFMNLCGYQDVMRHGCFLYLRVVDADGHPVPEANIESRPGGEALAKADSYGRLQTLFLGTKELVVTKDGFAQAEASPHCADNEEVDIRLVLHRVPPGGTGK
jgi:hypothetical protein